MIMFLLAELKKFICFGIPTNSNVKRGEEHQQQSYDSIKIEKFENCSIISCTRAHSDELIPMPIDPIKMHWRYEQSIENNNQKAALKQIE